MTPKLFILIAICLTENIWYLSKIKIVFSQWKMVRNWNDNIIYRQTSYKRTLPTDPFSFMWSYWLTSFNDYASIIYIHPVYLCFKQKRYIKKISSSSLNNMIYCKLNKQSIRSNVSNFTWYTRDKTLFCFHSSEASC